MRTMPRSSTIAVVLSGLVAVACTPTAPPVASTPRTAEARGTVVVLQGSAFREAASRDEAVRVAGERTARPAHAITEEPPVQRVVETSAAKLEAAIAKAARAEARGDKCKAKGRSPVTAMAERSDVIVRVKLEARTTARPATDADRKQLGATGLGAMLSAVGLGDDTVYETKLDGTVERITFPGAVTTAKQRVKWTGRRLGRKDATPPPSVGEALGKALDAMPAVPAAKWESLARGFVTGGCPVLGATVGATFLDGAAERRIRTAAAAALGPTRAPEPTETVEATPTPAPEPAPEVAAKPADPTYSCATLCTMHMVELCNNDRALWTQHGARWENTRCGIRRNEEFLAACYRMQWLSGTYEQSCVQPCESGEDGRGRLTAMLRRSGCIRAEGQIGSTRSSY
jgi:hypothetical protein